MQFKDLQGKKTYIIAVATVCYALGGAVAGFLDWNNAIMLIFGALGFGALRHGVLKEKPVITTEQFPTPGQ